MPTLTKPSPWGCHGLWSKDGERLKGVLVADTIFFRADPVWIFSSGKRNSACLKHKLAHVTGPRVQARFLDLLASRDIAENPHQWCAVLRYPGGILKVLNEAGFRAFMTPWIEQGSCDAVRSGGLEALQAFVPSDGGVQGLTYRQSYRLDSTVGRALMHADTFLSACLPTTSTRATTHGADNHEAASTSGSPQPNASKTTAPFSPTSRGGTVNEPQNPESSEVQTTAAGPGGGAPASPTAALMVDSTTCARHKVLSTARKATLDVATNVVVKHLEANFKVRVLAFTLDFALDRRGRLTLLWVGDATVASGKSGLDLSLAGLRPDRSGVRDSWLLHWTAKQAFEAKEKEAAAQRAATTPNPCGAKNSSRPTTRPASDNDKAGAANLHQPWVHEGSKEARAAVAAAAEVVEALHVEEAAELLGRKSSAPVTSSPAVSSSPSSFVTVRAAHQKPAPSATPELPQEASINASYFEPIHPHSTPVLRPVHAHEVGKGVVAVAAAQSNDAQPSPSSPSSSSSPSRMPQQSAKPSSSVVPSPRVHYGGGHLGAAAIASDLSNGQQKLFCSPRRFGESGDEGRVSMGGSDALELNDIGDTIAGVQSPNKQPYVRSNSTRSSPPSSGFGALNLRDPSFLDAGSDPSTGQPQRSASPTDGDFGLETIRAGDEGYYKAYPSSSTPQTMVPVSYHAIYRAQQESQRLLSGSGSAARWANNHGSSSHALRTSSNHAHNDNSSRAQQQQQKCDVGVHTRFELNSRQSPASSSSGGTGEGRMVQGGFEAGRTRPQSAGCRSTKHRAHGATAASEQRRLWASRVGLTSDAMPLGPGHFYRQVQVPAQDAHVVELFGQARKVRATVEECARASAEVEGEGEGEGGGGTGPTNKANSSSKGRPTTAPAAPLLTGGGERMVKPAPTGWGYFLELGLKKAKRQRRRRAAATQSAAGGTGVVNQEEREDEATQAVRSRSELAEKWRQLSRDERKIFDLAAARAAQTKTNKLVSKLAAKRAPRTRDYVDGEGASALDGAAPPEPWGHKDSNNNHGGGKNEGAASDNIHKSTAPRLFKVSAVNQPRTNFSWNPTLEERLALRAAAKATAQRAAAAKQREAEAEAAAWGQATAVNEMKATAAAAAAAATTGSTDEERNRKESVDEAARAFFERARASLQ